jgi:SAM-dependent methyltransferase
MRGETGERHGPLARRLRAVLGHPLARGIDDLDSPEATAVHARLIREKGLLRRLYASYYAAFEAAIDRAPPGGIVLEIGSGGGFYREMRPGLVSLDLRAGADVDVRASALSLPFRDGSVRAVVMLNVLHHLPDPRRFFRECARVLAPGGRVCMVEPTVTWLSRRLVRPLHHEPWEEAAPWELPAGGPMSAANMAMPWAIFVRDRPVYEGEFRDLQVDRLRPHTVLLYLLSGGVSMRSLVPGFLFAPLVWIERALGPLGRSLASMMTIELVRRT